MKNDWIGWASSLLLLATMVRQIYTQWRERSSRGVSRWLYIGQFSAQVGFIWYSWLVQNWVFVFTNCAMLILSVVGLAICYKQK